MNAFYICCVKDPFLAVAKRLQNNCGVNPVYWVGDRESAGVDNCDEQEVLNCFPNIVFQKYYDAYKGIFSDYIEKESSNTYFDLSFLNDYSAQAIQAISMMDRLDYDQHSFSFMERERHFFNLTKKWLVCLDKYNPEVVISAVNPHRVFDYVLYLLCQYKGIKYISFQMCVTVGRILPLVNFSKSDCIKSIVASNIIDITTNISLEQLPEDVRDNYIKLCGDYNSARPKYMATHDVNDVLNRNMFYLSKRFIKAHNFFGKHSMFVEGQKRTVYKNSKYSIEDSRFSLWEWYSKRKDTLKHNREMNNYYNSLCSDVDLSQPYIVFFLHYQPEETTSPNGGIFANQRLCIETLLKNTPSNICIYVKEHPNQFMSHMMGHTKRIKEFYDDLIANPRVKLIPFKLDSFSLISNALAVSTVTGTVGWEAAVRKKPVIVFGLIWYECLKAVLKVTDDASAKRIYDFIQSYRYDEQSILRYLYVMSKKSIRAYHYQGYKKMTGISQEDSVNNLYNSIVSLLKC